MIIKPNKAEGRKAKYEEVEVEYFIKTAKVVFTNRHKATENKTLKEIRWITKNMMNIETVFGKSLSTQKKEGPRSSRSVMPVTLPGG